MSDGGDAAVELAKQINLGFVPGVIVKFPNHFDLKSDVGYLSEFEFSDVGCWIAVIKNPEHDITSMIPVGNLVDCDILDPAEHRRLCGWCEGKGGWWENGMATT